MIIILKYQLIMSLTLEIIRARSVGTVWGPVNIIKFEKIYVSSLKNLSLILYILFVLIIFIIIFFLIYKLIKI